MSLSVRAKLILCFPIFLAIFLPGFKARAYPDFIGYGYRNCMLCHESGSGGGALTDYGRGVFASEIAANPFSKSMSAEDAAKISHFLGATELPWWIRLGIKYRTLTLESSPGSSSSRKFYYNMQDDLNLNFFADKNHHFAFISTLGYIENPAALYPNKTIKDDSHIFMREYFVRFQTAKELWLYLGFMDKVFGIKTANHTAVNRAPLSLGQNDQVHGFMAQWSRREEDIFFQYWLGNLHMPSSDRRIGGSFMIDRKWGAMHSYGLSLLSEKKESSDHAIVAVHNKMGFGNGNSLLSEGGFHRDKVTANGESLVRNNYYLFLQNNLNLTRGYFLVSGLELSKRLYDSTAPESLKWDLGFLIFPIQRMELRISAVNQKTYGAENPEKDQWAIQSQIHLSL